MKKALALLLTLVLLLGATACSGKPGEQNETTKPVRDTVTISTSKINQYDPFESYTAEQFNFMNCLYATLLYIGYDQNGQPQLVGDLAKSWELENDGAVFVFKLAENATFSNGEPITAEDVKFSLEKSAASPYHAGFTDMIKGVMVRDEHIVNKAAYEKDPEGYATDPVCSGAYTLESLDAATGNMTMQRRDDYWGDMPQIKTVNIRGFNDGNTSLIALEAKEIDARLVFGTSATQLSKNSEIVLDPVPSNSLGGIFINCTAAPWDNVKLRQALAYAIDYASIMQVLYDGRVESSSSIAYKSVKDPMPAGLHEYAQNIEEAKRLVTESGLSTPIDGGVLIGGSGGPGEMIQQYCAAIGINITTSDLSGGDFVNAIMSKSYSLCLIPGANAAVRGGNVLATTYASTSGSNYGGYSNARVDEIAAELAVETDETAYQAKLKEAMEIIAEEIPIIGLGVVQNYIAHRAELSIPTSMNGEYIIRLWKFQ